MTGAPRPTIAVRDDRITVIQNSAGHKAFCARVGQYAQPRKVARFDSRARFHLNACDRPVIALEYDIDLTQMMLPKVLSDQMQGRVHHELQNRGKHETLQQRTKYTIVRFDWFKRAVGSFGSRVGPIPIARQKVRYE